MNHMPVGWLLLSFMAVLVAVGTQAQPTPSQCQGAAYQLLDFWVGTWDVHLTGREDSPRVGTNLIEKTVGGCAVLEHWTDAAGSSGKSLFYYHPTEGAWKQVWVTDRGLIKEKRVVEPQGTGPVRFQGEIHLRTGARVLDRTTLTPMPDGRVRQHIETSDDAGVTWKTTFDAMYTRRP